MNLKKKKPEKEIENRKKETEMRKKWSRNLLEGFEPKKFGSNLLEGSQNQDR